MSAAPNVIPITPDAVWTAPKTGVRLRYLVELTEHPEMSASARVMVTRLYVHCLGSRKWPITVTDLGAEVGLKRTRAFECFAEARKYGFAESLPDGYLAVIPTRNGYGKPDYDLRSPSGKPDSDTPSPVRETGRGQSGKPDSPIRSKRKLQEKSTSVTPENSSVVQEFVAPATAVGDGVARKPPPAPTPLRWKSETELRKFAQELNGKHPQPGSLVKAIDALAELDPSPEQLDRMRESHDKWAPYYTAFRKCNPGAFVPNLAKWIEDEDWMREAPEPPKTMEERIAEAEAREAAKAAAAEAKAARDAEEQARRVEERRIAEANRPSPEQIARGNRAGDAHRRRWGKADQLTVELYARNLDDDAHADRCIEALLHMEKARGCPWSAKGFIEFTRREAQ